MHSLHFTQFGSEREIMTEIWTICQLQTKAVILLVICIHQIVSLFMIHLIKNKHKKKKYSQI